MTRETEQKLAEQLTAIRDNFLIPTPDKDFTDYAIMTRCIAALSAPDHIGDVTEMVRAADEVSRFINGLNPSGGEVRVSVPALQLATERLIAALSAPVSGGEGEAVAWMLRDPHTGMVFFTDQVSAENFLNPEKVPVQPLYTHPSDPAPVSGGEGEDRYRESVAVRRMVSTLMNIAYMDCYTREGEEPVHLLMMRQAKAALSDAPVHELSHPSDPAATERMRAEPGESLDDAARRIFASEKPGAIYDHISNSAKMSWMRRAWRAALGEA